jgi:hypothetical protein
VSRAEAIAREFHAAYGRQLSDSIAWPAWGDDTEGQDLSRKVLLAVFDELLQAGVIVAGPGGKVDPQTRAEFDAWLADHQEVTGKTAPKAGTKARANVLAAYRARRAEGYSHEDLLLVTRGAMKHEYRVEQGYITAASILRPDAVADLLERGRAASESEQRRTQKLLGDWDPLA